MKFKKDIIIESVDEDISELLAEQNRKEFISELNSLELKYNVKNIEKYAKYLNEKLSFPLIGYYSIDNGIFGKERVEIKINGMIENQSRQGIKCTCEIPGNSNLKIHLHLIEISETDINTETINHFKNWYFKNHKKK